MTTHVLAVAEGMCDRVGILQDGSLIEIGTLPELRVRHGAPDATLEDIFLGLTGAATYDNDHFVLYEDGTSKFPPATRPIPA
jgi:ABC-type multidrug transport system ATPase subunit